MPGSWPEPFGLVAIESLACGTPILARRVGGLAEIIRNGVDGFFGDDVTQLAFLVPQVAGLDRKAIRKSVLDRFSATRMVDGYEALYHRVLEAGDSAEPGDGDDAEETGEAVGPGKAQGRVVDMASRRSGSAS
jgi:glycogen synthase